MKNKTAGWNLLLEGVTLQGLSDKDRKGISEHILKGGCFGKLEDHSYEKMSMANLDNLISELALKLTIATNTRENYDIFPEDLVKRLEMCGKDSARELNSLKDFGEILSKVPATEDIYGGAGKGGILEGYHKALISLNPTGWQDQVGMQITVRYTHGKDKIWLSSCIGAEAIADLADLTVGTERYLTSIEKEGAPRDYTRPELERIKRPILKWKAEHKLSYGTCSVLTDTDVQSEVLRRMLEAYEIKPEQGTTNENRTT